MLFIQRGVVLRRVLPALISPRSPRTPHPTVGGTREPYLLRDSLASCASIIACRRRCQRDTSIRTVHVIETSSSATTGTIVWFSGLDVATGTDDFVHFLGACNAWASHRQMYGARPRNVGWLMQSRGGLNFSVVY